MSVNQFKELNSLRPANARWGEVTSIELFVTDWAGQSFEIGWSKRKSIHVPPSSNAYWNWMSLRADLARWVSDKGIYRDLRSSLYAALSDAVRNTHRISLVQHYLDEVEDATQYFTINIKIDCKVFDIPTVKSSVYPSNDDSDIVYSANHVVW